LIPKEQNAESLRTRRNVEKRISILFPFETAYAASMELRRGTMGEVSNGKWYEE